MNSSCSCICFVKNALASTDALENDSANSSTELAALPGIPSRIFLIVSACSFSTSIWVSCAAVADVILVASASMCTLAATADSPETTIAALVSSIKKLASFSFLNTCSATANFSSGSGTKAPTIPSPIIPIIFPNFANQPIILARETIINPLTCKNLALVSKKKIMPMVTRLTQPSLLAIRLSPRASSLSRVNISASSTP